MRRKNFSSIGEESYFSAKTLNWLSLVLALVISICLGIAAYGKFFYPSAKLQLLDRVTSIFELGMVCFLLLFRRRAWCWMAMAILFASWGGYAIYWCCLELPCNCIGSMVPLPSGFALSFDILAFILSSVMALLLGAACRAIYLTILVALLCSLFGYAFAEWLFYVKIVGVNWVLF